MPATTKILLRAAISFVIGVTTTTRVLSSVSLLLHAHVKINFIAAPQLWNTIFLQLFPENNWLIINKTKKALNL